MNHARYLLHTEGFVARPELEEILAKSAEKLFRHGEAALRLRLNLVRSVPHSGVAVFSATARLERAGNDAVAHAEASEPETALREVVAKLERRLASDAGHRRHDERHPHGIELPVELPKTV